MWTPFPPIGRIDDDNREPIVKWLDDKIAVLRWFTSIVTGSLVLVSLFGRKPGLGSPSELFLSAAVACLFISVLLNLICVWQAPKWKFAILVSQVSDGRNMMWDIEISSWISLVFFLAGLVASVIGNL
ncbi:hypothetical protein NZK33_21160 [Cyanobium sp. FGCU-6]|nr:hypothetical protein [Cyanobium sp. FGCU6]